MTDKEKLEKVIAEIERIYHQSLFDENRQAELGLSSAACTSYGKSKACKELLSFTDSMQKEPANDELEKVVEEIVDPTVLNAYGAKEIANRLRRTVIESINRDLEGWHVL